MTAKKSPEITAQRVELDGIRYVIVRESVFDYLCEEAGVQQGGTSSDRPSEEAGLELDRATLAEKLVQRRRAVGLSQAELARRAGVRPETLNRIERGRTMPDFATVRKLVTAMNATEQENLGVKSSSSSSSHKESPDVRGKRSDQ